jgi:lysophospholipase L1-like esterase
MQIARPREPRPLRLARVLLIPLLLWAPTAARAAWEGENWADYSAYIAAFTPAVETRICEIASRGAAIGRRAGRVGQYGDSISESWAFLRNVLVDGPVVNETGHDYAPVIDWLRGAYADASREEGRLGEHLGKGPAYGNKGGWTLADLVDYGHPARAAERGDGLDPGNYAWAIVMLGSNDIHRSRWDAADWRRRLEDLLVAIADLGIVPVLSTIPPRVEHLEDGRVGEANDAVRVLARQLALPLADYHALVIATRPGDWQGTLLAEDGVHPSAGGGGRDFSRQGLEFTDGYAQRSKLVLDVAERLRPLLARAYDSETQAACGASRTRPARGSGRVQLRKE